MIWREVGAGACDLPQLGAWLGHDSITSGAFRLKVAAAKTFGLITTSQNSIRLTALGRRIVDPENEPGAKVDAFLNVPLYKALYDKYAGSLLPNNVGLEREIAELGVATKQTDKARQAFQRSATEAGFFKEGVNRLVRPGAPAREGGDASEAKRKDTSGGGGDGPRTHPFIKGLVDTLPEAYSDWPGEKQEEWIAAAKAIFRIIYPQAGSARTAAVELGRRGGLKGRSGQGRHCSGIARIVRSVRAPRQGSGDSN